MITGILLLAVVFIAGLLITNLPSKFFAMFISIISVKNPSPSSVPSVLVTSKKKTISCSNKQDLKRIFATFDTNGDGNITKQELKQSFKNIGMTMNEVDIEDLIRSVDTNEDGLIDLEEFCESFGSLLNTEEEEDGERELKEAFDVFDEDKDGVITVEELGLVLTSMGFKQGNRLEECSKMIKKVDIDGDGMVNFDEFKKMMNHGHGFVTVA